MAEIKFKAKLHKPDEKDPTSSGVLLTLPKSASAKLPTKGMSLVKGTFNEKEFQTVLEPNGKGSHWFKVKNNLLKATNAKLGDTVTLSVEPSKDWPEPKVPENLKQMLDKDPKAKEVWNDITPMARWDWIRWVGAAKQQKTREKRIEVARSKLNSGMRRACCFNRTECSLTDA